MRVLTHSGVAERRRDRVWWWIYRRGLEQASTEALVPGMGSQVQSGMSETGVTHGLALACKTPGAIGGQGANGMAWQAANEHGLNACHTRR
jgi:hypothetical protein